MKLLICEFFRFLKEGEIVISFEGPEEEIGKTIKEEFSDVNMSLYLEILKLGGFNENN